MWPPVHPSPWGFPASLPPRGPPVCRHGQNLSILWGGSEAQPAAVLIRWRISARQQSACGSFTVRAAGASDSITKSLTMRCYPGASAAARHPLWSEDLMSVCAACGVLWRAIEECTARQSELHSGFHAGLSWLDSLKAWAKITLVRISLCMARTACVCLWGSHSSPGERVILLSRPQTPPQSKGSTEKMKADASLPPFLSRLFLLRIELCPCACWASTNRHTQTASHVNLENSSQRLKCHRRY